MKQLSVISFVGAVVLSGAPPLALLLIALGLILAVVAYWP